MGENLWEDGVHYILPFFAVHAFGIEEENFALILHMGNVKDCFNFRINITFIKNEMPNKC